MEQPCLTGDNQASTTLQEREQQLVSEVLCLYREGGNLATLGMKIRELRTVRAQLGMDGKHYRNGRMAIVGYGTSPSRAIQIWSFL